MAQAGRLQDHAQRAQRWDCNVAVVARGVDGKEYPIRIANLSNGGFMAESDVSIAVGTHITFEMPGAEEMQAQVRWAIGKRFGAMIIED